MTADAPGLCRRRVRDTVRAARQARGLTQRQAATALDWSLSKLVRIETAVMRARLAGLAAHPRISVRGVPFTAGAYPPAPGISYTIIDPRGDTADAVYLETASGSVICRPGREQAGRYRGYLDATYQKSAGIRGRELLTRVQAQAAGRDGGHEGRTGDTIARAVAGSRSVLPYGRGHHGG